MNNISSKILFFVLISLRRLRNIRAKKDFPVSLTKTDSLIKQLASNNNGVCHIIASGSSVLETMSIIGEEDTVIGFNFSGFLPIKFDFYLI